MLYIIRRSLVAFSFFCLLSNVAHSQITTEPVCLIPTAVPFTIDGSATTDWSTFSPTTIQYDAAGNFVTHLATDGTDLFFLTEVTAGNFSAIQVHAFRIGVAGATNRMLQITPFDSGDTSLDNNLFDPSDFTNNPFGGTWDGTWTAPTVPADNSPSTDFHRFLDNSPTEWRLEGRVALADLGITDPNNFDLYLHIAVGFSGGDLIDWPAQTAPFDRNDPTTLDFGENRCPDLEFSEPYLSFGKVDPNVSTPPTLSVNVENNGAPNSVLAITSLGLDPSGDSEISAVSFPAPTININAGSSITLTVEYNPTSPSSIGNPHTSAIEIVSNDPDDPDVSLPVQGLSRKPIDTVFILDQSGSMLNQDKWVTTEWASEIAYEAMRVFSGSDDRVGAVWFGGTSSTPDADPLTSPVFSGFTGTSTSFAGTFLQDAQSNFYTPVGLGIEEAHQQFAADINRSNIGLLMSDGIHNRPTSTSGATTVAGLNLLADVQNNTKSMLIHTVALGMDSGVSVDLLESIRSHYNATSLASAPATTYNITANPSDLADLFVEPLMEPFLVNRVAPIAATDDFIVEANAHAVLAMVAWDQSTAPADIRVDLFDAGGGTFIKTYNSGSPEVEYHLGASPGTPYTRIYVDDPDEFTETRQWRIRTAAGASLPSFATPFVLVDLNIIGYFTAIQEVDGTGNAYTLEARLTEAGWPITNTPATPVEVRAEIARPGEGFGELLSTISLEDCEARAPVLPRLPKQGPVIDAPLDGGRFSQGAIRQNQVVRSSSLASSQTDSLTYRFAWAEAYFERCDRDGLLRIEDNSLQLVDDGTNGDEVADDGIYTLRFTDTEYEGSYVVRFTVHGTAPSGAGFSRTRTLSTYIPVSVNPSNSVFNSRLYLDLRDVRIREYYVIPRDGFGRHFGPGKGDRVSFNIVDGSGSFVSGVNDYNNGIYSTLVQFNRGDRPPEVSVDVDGAVFPPHDPRKPAELHLFAGATFFDDAINLDTSPVIGARFGFSLSQNLFLEAEGGITFAQGPRDVSGNVIQLLGNLRYDINVSNQAVFFLTGGAGYVLFRDFPTDDEAFAYQGGAGLTIWLNNKLGLRGDARVLRFGDLYNIGETTNFQATGALVIRL